MNDVTGRVTGMQVHESTKRLLDQLKLVPMESYENVILRLIEEYRKQEA